MNDVTRLVIHWIIDVRGEAPMLEALATADDVRSFVCGPARWDNSAPGPVNEMEAIDFATVDWAFILKMLHTAL